MAKTFPFRFKEAQWDEVLGAYSKVSGLMALDAVRPTGTFTFNVPAGPEFTLEEITDIINEELATQNKVLVPRRITYSVVPTDLAVDRPRARTDLADLGRLPRQEVVSVLIPLKKERADALVPALRKLLGPRGTLVRLEKAHAILVRDTVRTVCLIANVVDEDPEKGAEPAKAVVEKTFAFDMKDAKWNDVFDWYAKVTELKAEIRAEPKGTFTCVPGKDQQLTLGEITDRINGELTGQQLVLIPNRKTFAVVSREGKIDAKFVPVAELNELAKLPRTAIVEVLVPTPIELDEELAVELKKYLTPLGEILFAKRRWLVVRDTVENIERIRRILRDPCPAGDGPQEFFFGLKDATWDQVFATYEELTGLTAVLTARPKGTFTFTPALRNPEPMRFPGRNRDDERLYTLAEITDIINDGLRPNNLMLFRRRMTFMVVPADEKVAPELLPRIEPAELPRWGRTELVQVLFDLSNINDPVAERAAVDEAKKLLGVLGSVVQARRSSYLVQDTAGNVTKIKKRLDELAAPKQK